jgi:hypothetical protein
MVAAGLWATTWPEGDVTPGGRRAGVQAERLALEEGPPALSRHLERLRESIPGNLGEPAEGPGAAGDEKLAAMAYPDTDISLASVQGMHLAYTNVRGRGFPTGKGRDGTWVTVGPTDAIYPFTPLRGSFNYVPNTYAAGGRRR